MVPVGHSLNWAAVIMSLIRLSLTYDFHFRILMGKIDILYVARKTSRYDKVRFDLFSTQSNLFSLYIGGPRTN